MSSGHTDGTGSTLRISEARIYAAVAHTRQLIPALRVQLTFTLLARNKRVSDITSGTSAHRSLGSGTIMARSALRISTARVWFTQVTSFERPAECERITGHVSWAGTDGRESTKVAICVNTTRVQTRIDASVVHTGRLVARTLSVRCTLGRTDAVWVTVVAPWTLANSTMGGNSLAVRIDAAVATRTHTLEVPTRLGSTALAVRLTLMTAPTQWTTSITWQAGTYSLVVGDVTLSVGTARRWVTSLLRIGNSAS